MCFDIFIKRLVSTPPEKRVCHGGTCWPLTCKISQSAMISQWHFRPHSLMVWFLCRQRQALVTGIASLHYHSIPQSLRMRSIRLHSSEGKIIPLSWMSIKTLCEFSQLMCWYTDFQSKFRVKEVSQNYPDLHQNDICHIYYSI